MEQQIPGQDKLFSGSNFPKSALLLTGPSGSGKTAYCMQFLRDGIAKGDRCVFVSCSPALDADAFKSFFADSQAPVFQGLTGKDPSRALDDLLGNIKSALAASASARVVVDSVTHLAARFPSDVVLKFVAGVYDLLKQNGAAGIFTLTTTSTPIADDIGSLLDGTMQIRMEDKGDKIARDMRILALKAARHSPKWASFQITEDGKVRFGEPAAASEVCKLCERAITGAVSVSESGSPFHPQCFDTYRKLGEMYGSNSIYTLQAGVVNANFFFIDIVGLSDPSLSVEKQTKKIESLNSLIGSCEAFTKTPRDRKIILPTGDGMAIGFLLNPELPLQLSMQLHYKLRLFNAKADTGNQIGVRIGLSSGPVFIVSDINNNQNVWGPGIILARRVMDLGDGDHILLADSLAEALMNLKDEYRAIIHPIDAGYRIKHGQVLKLYSAYSQEFGNPKVPAKISDQK